MPTDNTATGILKLVEEFDVREGASPARGLYITLLNAAIDEISAGVGGIDTHWNNDSADSTYGRLALSGNRVTFPSDVVTVYKQGVFWNGLTLVETEIQILDAESEQWRTLSGTPGRFARWANGLVLDYVPSGATEAMLEVQGLGTIPHYADGDSTNPLVYIPLHYQLAFKDYPIGNLPLNYANKPEAVIATMRQARADAQARWAKASPLIVSAVKQRATPAWSY